MFISTTELIHKLQDYESKYGPGMIAGFVESHANGIVSTCIRVRDEHFLETLKDHIVEVPHTDGDAFFID